MAYDSRASFTDSYRLLPSIVVSFTHPRSCTTPPTCVAALTNKWRLLATSLICLILTKNPRASPRRWALYVPDSFRTGAPENVIRSSPSSHNLTRLGYPPVPNPSRSRSPRVRWCHMSRYSPIVRNRPVLRALRPTHPLGPFGPTHCCCTHIHSTKRQQYYY